MTIFGPFLGHFRVLGHNSGHGPLKTQIFGSGESSDIVRRGRAINFLSLFTISIWSEIVNRRYELDFLFLRRYIEKAKKSAKYEESKTLDPKKLSLSHFICFLESNGES